MQTKHIKQTISYVQPIMWPVESVNALTTNRLTNANSSSPYSAFNLGLHVGDDSVQVQHNRQLLLNYLPNGSAIQWLDQVHSNDVVVIDKVSAKPIVADAALTSAPNVALAIMTADCLPILLSDKKGKTIAAIHGGWRSLMGNIINRTIAKMAIDPEDIIAWLGPCIGPNAFEVGLEVKQAFTSLSTGFSFAFTPRPDDKFLCNLQWLGQRMLTIAGVKEITSLDDCTYSLPTKYYSYRRDRVTGRMASVICLA